MLAGAETEARRRDHQTVDVEHLLLALLDQQDGLARPPLEKIGAPPDRVRSRIEDELRTRPRVEGGEQLLGQRLAELLDRADDEARRLKDEYVSTEHRRWPPPPRRGPAARRCARRAPPPSGSRGP